MAGESAQSGVGVHLGAGLVNRGRAPPGWPDVQGTEVRGTGPGRPFQPPVPEGRRRCRGQGGISSALGTQHPAPGRQLPCKHSFCGTGSHPARDLFHVLSKSEVAPFLSDSPETKRAGPLPGLARGGLGGKEGARPQIQSPAGLLGWEPGALRPRCLGAQQAVPEAGKGVARGQKCPL